MLSHRYGWRGLPTRIVEKEFKILLGELNNQISINKTFEFTDDEGKLIKFENILESCYELDYNSVPARYRLKFLDKLFPTLDQKLKNFGKTWSSLEEKMGSLLRNLAQICHSKELISESDCERFFVSGICLNELK
jgi:hypothetical protein